MGPIECMIVNRSVSGQRNLDAAVTRATMLPCNAELFFKPDWGPPWPLRFWLP